MKEVTKLSKIPLSSDDISKMLNGKTRIINYKQFMERDNIDQVLKPFGSCVILYETSDNFGHWCAIIKRGDNVEWFDSYSYKPDEERKFIPKRYLKNYPFKHLVKLLLESPYKIRYNNYELQDRDNKYSATCGRWVVARILLKDLDEHQFAKLFTGKGINPDLLVTVFTNNLDQI